MGEIRRSPIAQIREVKAQIQLRVRKKKAGEEVSSFLSPLTGNIF